MQIANAYCGYDQLPKFIDYYKLWVMHISTKYSYLMVSLIGLIQYVMNFTEFSVAQLFPETEWVIM